MQKQPSGYKKAPVVYTRGAYTSVTFELQITV